MSGPGPRCCAEAGLEVRIVDPKRVRSFALSAGRLAKNDTIDAEDDRLVRRDIQRCAGPET